jgi:SAM-dependent methyltransferase
MEENRSFSQPNDVWASAESYEIYVGRWSRLVAKRFLDWLAVRPDSRWLDVGCGTGALTQAILEEASPQAVKGIDASKGYIEYARQLVSDSRATFHTGNALSLPLDKASVDAVVSGFFLNFITQPVRAVREMFRAARPGGVVAAYVWDYAGRVQFMRHFWNAAAAMDPAAVELDEGRRFPICNPDRLAELCKEAGLNSVEVAPIDLWTVFNDFEDYWSPFLGGQGPAPGYAKSLSEDRVAALRERIRAAMPFALDGSIPLTARAWAVRGTC